MTRPSTWCESCGRWKALDACSGEGGSSKGLMDAGWCVTAIDNDPARLRRNPAQHTVLVDDAVIYIADHGYDCAFVWAGPPCQDYSAGTRAMRAHGIPTGYKRLIATLRALMDDMGLDYVIENVEGARSEMRDPLLLCGRMFGLAATDADGTDLVMDRHRLFETRLPLVAPAHPAHTGQQVAGVYGGSRRAKRRPNESLADVAPRDRHEAKYVRKGGYVPRSPQVQAQLLGIDWMTQQGLYLSIPPAYAHHFGVQALQHLTHKDAA